MMCKCLVLKLSVFLCYQSDEARSLRNQLHRSALMAKGIKSIEMANLEKILDFDWDQYNLDENGSQPKDPKFIECPHCGESFEG